MKFKSVTVTNFCSYTHMCYDFKDARLVLISGDNGAGKSTFCDVIPWVLYGKTSKGGSTTDVIKWGCESATYGVVLLTVNSREIEVCRVRGSKAKDNDLYMTVDGQDPIRGKDLTDTQKLINQTLGVDYQGFVLSHYIHEFSIANNFFSTTSKNRKEIIDQLIDFTKIDRLKVNLDVDKKKTKAALELVGIKYRELEFKQTHLETSIQDTNIRIKKWNASNQIRQQQCSVMKKQVKKKTTQLAGLDKKELQSTLQSLKTAKCEHCNGPINHPEVEYVQNQLTVLNTLESEIRVLQDKIKRESSDSNPYLQQTKIDTSKLTDIAGKIEEVEFKMQESLILQEDQELLSDVIKTYRADMTSTTVSILEDKANQLLSEYFDGELTISLTVDMAEDKIETMIHKNGNMCTYQQLSKGQRQILKFCFSLAIMKQLGSTLGIHPDVLMFDEIFDGLSESSKSKAFKLLKSLEIEYSNIFVVEHSMDLKPFFDTIYSVSLIDGKSQLNET